MNITLNVTLATLLLAVSGLAETPATQPADGLTVMSFNLRYSTANDGENHWDKRRKLLLKVIQSHKPDLLGTQECLAEQLDFLTAEMPDYQAVGVGRDDGKRGGEFSAILFRRDRFELLDSGTFWLSETPEVVGSKGWDAAICRVATWAKLRDRNSRRELLFLNTHFDHRGEQARTESAKLIAGWLRTRAAELPVVIAGDFNATDSSEAYRALVRPQPGGLIDAYRALHPRQADEATFHGFEGKTEGERIDWILCSAEFVPNAASIDRTHEAGRYPSDHFPMMARLKWR